MAHKIIILNPVEACCEAGLAKLIAPLLSWTSVYYKPGFRGKERKEYQKSIMIKGPKNMYYFWSGLVQTITDHCAENNIEVVVDDRSKTETPLIYEPELPGITFRKDQEVLINSFLDNLRGILVSFTGSGKTILGLACLSSFENVKILWLCHKIGLMTQTKDEAIKFGFKSVGLYGDGTKEIDKDLVIASRQSFKNIADECGHLFDVVVVDEVHHVASADGEYAYVLSRVMAPIRLGLTATLPKTGEAHLTAVGLIGPVLQTLTINEGAELGILAKPTIRILRMMKDYEISRIKKYAEAYDAAVVDRLARHKLIALTAKKHVVAKDTVLILITKLRHGENIMKELKAVGVACHFVRGATKTEERDRIKHELNSGKIGCVVASSVWVEGINIPNLNVVICASGGKSEIATIQAVGRGLRKTKDKDVVTIYDIFDQTHHYLIDHFGERLCLYLEAGWL